MTFSASGLPSGVTATFGANPTTYSSQIVLTASATAATGSYNSHHYRNLGVHHQDHEPSLSPSWPRACRSPAGDRLHWVLVDGNILRVCIREQRIQRNRNVLDQWPARGNYCIVSRPIPSPSVVRRAQSLITSRIQCGSGRQLYGNAGRNQRIVDRVHFDHACGGGSELYAE